MEIVRHHSIGGQEADLGMFSATFSDLRASMWRVATFKVHLMQHDILWHGGSACCIAYISR